MLTLAGAPEPHIVDISNRKAIPPFAALRAFEAVGRLGGVRRGAQSLGLDHAVVSRHLKALEDWSGVRLIDRAHGGGRLTEEGQRYHLRIAQAIADIASATADLTRMNTLDQLNIWCVPGFASQWLMSRLGTFRANHPDLDFEFHPTDVAPDFSRHEADADLRYVISANIGVTTPGVRSVEIARPPVFPVCSPALKARLDTIREPADLLKAPILHEDSHEEWRGWFAANGVDTGGKINGPRLWHAHLTLDAARRGEGVALANPFLLGDDIEAGRLVAVEVGRAVTLGAYVFFARKDRWDTPAVVRFRRWLQGLTAADRQAA
jgi:DNA-binding transcriptional LysR family regulator